MAPTVVFVLGGPGAGKGTQCENLARDFPEICHLSAGDLLRAEQDDFLSPYGALISDCIRNGEIVPVEITISLLERAITENEETGKTLFLIDGFPRAMDQAKRFEKDLGPPKVVLYFECTEEQLIERLLKRGETSGRSDDNIESIRKRFVTFHQTSYPVIQSYQALKKVLTISSVDTPEKVYELTKVALSGAGILAYSAPSAGEVESPVETQIPAEKPLPPIEETVSVEEPVPITMPVLPVKESPQIEEEQTSVVAEISAAPAEKPIGDEDVPAIIVAASNDETPGEPVNLPVTQTQVTAPNDGIPAPPLVESVVGKDETLAGVEEEAETKAEEMVSNEEAPRTIAEHITTVEALGSTPATVENTVLIMDPVVAAKELASVEETTATPSELLAVIKNGPTAVEEDVTAGETSVAGTSSEVPVAVDEAKEEPSTVVEDAIVAPLRETANPAGDSAVPEVPTVDADQEVPVVAEPQVTAEDEAATEDVPAGDLEEAVVSDKEVSAAPLTIEEPIVTVETADPVEETADAEMSVAPHIPLSTEEDATVTEDLSATEVLPAKDEGAVVEEVPVAVEASAVEESVSETPIPATDTPAEKAGPAVGEELTEEKPAVIEEEAPSAESVTVEEAPIVEEVPVAVKASAVEESNSESPIIVTDTPTEETGPAVGEELTEVEPAVIEEEAPSAESVMVEDVPIPIEEATKEVAIAETAGETVAETAVDIPTVESPQVVEKILTEETADPIESDTMEEKLTPEVAPEPQKLSLRAASEPEESTPEAFLEREESTTAAAREPGSVLETVVEPESTEVAPTLEPEEASTSVEEPAAAVDSEAEAPAAREDVPEKADTLPSESQAVEDPILVASGIEEAPSAVPAELSEDAQTKTEVELFSETVVVPTLTIIDTDSVPVIETPGEEVTEKTSETVVELQRVDATEPVEDAATTITAQASEPVVLDDATTEIEGRVEEIATEYFHTTSAPPEESKGSLPPLIEEVIAPAEKLAGDIAPVEDIATIESAGEYVVPVEEEVVPQESTPEISSSGIENVITEGAVPESSTTLEQPASPSDAAMEPEALDASDKSQIVAPDVEVAVVEEEHAKLDEATLKIGQPVSETYVEPAADETPAAAFAESPQEEVEAKAVPSSVVSEVEFVASKASEGYVELDKAEASEPDATLREIHNSVQVEKVLGEEVMASIKVSDDPIASVEVETAVEMPPTSIIEPPEMVAVKSEDTPHETPEVDPASVPEAGEKTSTTESTVAALTAVAAGATAAVASVVRRETEPASASAPEETSIEENVVPKETPTDIPVIEDEPLVQEKPVAEEVSSAAVTSVTPAPTPEPIVITRKELPKPTVSKPKPNFGGPTLPTAISTEKPNWLKGSATTTKPSYLSSSGGYSSSSSYGASSVEKPKPSGKVSALIGKFSSYIEEKERAKDEFKRKPYVKGSVASSEAASSPPSSPFPSEDTYAPLLPEVITPANAPPTSNDPGTENPIEQPDSAVNKSTEAPTALPAEETSTSASVNPSVSEGTTKDDPEAAAEPAAGDAEPATADAEPPTIPTSDTEPATGDAEPTTVGSDDTARKVGSEVEVEEGILQIVGEGTALAAEPAGILAVEPAGDAKPEVIEDTVVPAVETSSPQVDGGQGDGDPATVAATEADGVPASTPKETIEKPDAETAALVVPADETVADAPTEAADMPPVADVPSADTVSGQPAAVDDKSVLSSQAITETVTPLFKEEAGESTVAAVAEASTDPMATAKVLTAASLPEGPSVTAEALAPSAAPKPAPAVASAPTSTGTAPATVKGKEKAAKAGKDKKKDKSCRNQ
ncbi:hypothetical protein HDU93_001443 [Gonapodya sp. JEL0774]|nr:hypothetical protein HDU93_001443 [Gonapodya sp. JEL0774]